ncbi:hypothetical protein EJ04DRAFT_508886 [Polyplosphaeria fusca]|uniref:Uncharacterized protein n=1 Tax=Polyplosphaeria fusca TaxID=682080 RepID=A0A9P4RA08_9PLEO|nr:hypothetical protein EJ04DRAFT_508886 [Polyplosphaeria fusca]
MATRNPCPIRELDAELRDYINSRQQTLSIRQALLRGLTANTKAPDSSSLRQHLSYACPYQLSAIPRRAQDLTPNQSRFLRALEAHSKVQVRHGKLVDALHELRDQSTKEGPNQTESNHDSRSTRDYVSLLGQRQRLAELQIVDESLEQLLNASPSGSRIDPASLVKEAIGDQPGLPAEPLEMSSREKDGNNGAFRLKREVIEARARLQRAESLNRNAASESRHHSSLEQKVCALGRARDEMVTWVETELAKMTEESELLEDASPLKRQTQDANVVDLTRSESQIREEYNRYVASRAAAVQAQDSIQPCPLAAAPSGAQTVDLKETACTTSSPTAGPVIDAVLAQITSLKQISDNERSLLQNAIYLQSQISTADAESREALTRLSEESLILGSASKELSAWRDTAMQAEANTQETTAANLNATRQEIDCVHGVVDLCSLHSSFLDSTTRT